MQLKDKFEKSVVTSESMSLEDVMHLINNGELKSSIPFMAFNRADRRVAEKQAKQFAKRFMESQLRTDMK
jgi:hypothetical protein